ncbi:hypothetical protein N8I77_006955 [Diaporthe amygdali]|uniref:Uncharacterized protein n=1 Tax=Phomopsis amygdali TaxID=1214568 RepID=A0AAD9SHN1_PHOAM|nr:hypothetical protein N8I77_006955 [Diaporthe amygdali]
MDESSPVQSDETQPLRTGHARLAIANNEFRHNSYGESVSPSPPSSLNDSHSTVHGRREEAAPAYTLIGSKQRKNNKIRHQDRNPSYASEGLVQRLWLWEALSITVAALALAAIVITLILHGDRPLPKWPTGITINALISVFTAILKASLMMPIAESIGQLKWLWYLKSHPLGQMEQWDLASRGPWGSLLLIFMLKSQDLAVIGAMLTIVAMAVDPFTQQIVQYYSCPIIAESAIYTGLLDPPANISAVLNFECRTGNCTFLSTDDGATFLSLALESRCANINNNISTPETVQSFTSPGDNKTHTYVKHDYATLPKYGIHFPNENEAMQENVMQSGYQDSQGWPSSFLNRVSFLMAANTGEKWIGGYLSGDLSDRERTGSDSRQSVQAFECEFYPAVNTYRSNITNGVLLEQVLDSQRMDVWPVALDTHALLLVNRTIREGEWHKCTGRSEPSDEHDFPIIGWPSYKGLNIGTSLPLAQLINRSGDAWNQSEWWPHDCVYWIPYAPIVGLSIYIHRLLGNESLYIDPVIDRAKGNPWSVNLWNGGNATLETVQAAMDGLARSVTARWRQGDGISNNIGPAIGTVWETQTCVHVNWAWISLPAGLLLLTIVFLLLTVLRTNSKRVRPWKSSMLAVLFNGLDLHTREDAGPAVSLER